MEPSNIAYSRPKLFIAVFIAKTNYIYSNMIFVNRILYLLSAWYSIFSFNQFFIIKILPYWFVTKIFGNYRKYDNFFSFRFTENMIFPSIAEMFLRKCCFSCSGIHFWCICKDDTIRIMKNFDLNKKSESLYNFFHNKKDGG